MVVHSYSNYEEREQRAAMARSWEGARRDLADPEVRARIDAQLARLDSSPPARLMTGEEFLASVGINRPSSAG